MNISQHCFVPLGFKKGYYNDNRYFVVDSSTYCSDLIHVDNCSSCVVYRQVNKSSVGGYLRVFNGNTLVRKAYIGSVSRFPYSINFNPGSNLEIVLSYGIPVGLVDFLVYDDPSV